MSKKAKIVLTVLGTIALIGVGWFALAVVLPIFDAVYAGKQQMAAGKKFMDSLTEKDFQTWTERTQKYLKNYNATNWTITTKEIPQELAELKILRIDENSNYVAYVWMGGFDHTELLVERMTNGQLQFTAVYSDESNRVIWPKIANNNK